MKKIMIANCILTGLFTVALTAPAALASKPADTPGQPNKPVNPGKTEETAGNNLSFPVIWAEGVAKTLPGGGEPRHDTGIKRRVVVSVGDQRSRS